ncbi:TetM/TetW/TetO/TetS family tetracycline resistance ribosomal protection protein [Kribbella sp. NBC_01245]|uniref:translation factor GTPase family protein n=1 Tax=Kribbella sp. NBC_01245 TaxID=2903578 RepID=UPI002E2B5A0A|nr:translation factor GTPase family protein [Kribbella sp. NBC_01245]
MLSLNLGILAHIDAGKTSLTERLLHAAGVIDEIGSVDDGNTQTDSLALERQRGITIKSAVVSFQLNELAVNLIDTPGHPDFIAEVDRVLGALDGAVLVVSAVEGVQAQTRVLMRTLQRLRIPTIIFVNKIDRAGAQYDALLERLAAKLAPEIVAMGSTTSIGTRAARFTPYDGTDPGFTANLVDVLAEHDEDLLAAYVRDESSIEYGELRKRLAVRTAEAQAHPVYFGSAMTGVGLDELIAGIREFLPARAGDADGPVAGTVFKVDRAPSGAKVAYVRLFSGTIRTRDVLPFGDNAEAKVTAIDRFEGGVPVSGNALAAGQIGRLWGLSEIRIGDRVGTGVVAEGKHFFAPPSLESVIYPERLADKGRLRMALAQLAEQDPLINVRQDDIRQEMYVSLYGEVQKEVIQATLANDFGITVGFRETTTICVERLQSTGEAFEVIATGENPFLATVGLRVEPGPIGSGVEFRLEVELGSMPIAFFRTVEETVHETLEQGVHGWQLTDCVVTMTRSGYWARQSHSHGTFDKSMSSTAGDFRNLTPLVLMDAVQRAHTVVHEPVHHFRMELPADAYGPILPLITRLRGIPHSPELDGVTCVLEGDIPAASVHELEQMLPGLTSGEGVLETAFERYDPVTGLVPERPRTDHNPLNRKEYLLHVERRV